MNEVMKITVPAGPERESIDTIEGWLDHFTEAQLVEIIHRYCNTQDGAKKYRTNAAERMKALKEYARVHGIEY